MRVGLVVMCLFYQVVVWMMVLSLYQSSLPPSLPPLTSSAVHSALEVGLDMGMMMGRGHWAAIVRTNSSENTYREGKEGWERREGGVEVGVRGQ